MKSILNALAFLFFLSAILPGSIHAQPLFRLYGITPQNSLVEINLDDPSFPQQPVALFSVPGIVGIDYDSGLNRLLGLDSEGLLHIIDRNTGNASFLANLGGALGGQVVGMTFDSSVPPPQIPEIILCGMGFQFPEIARVEGREPNFELVASFQTASDNITGVSIDPTSGQPTSGQLYFVNQTNQPFFSGISLMNKATGEVTFLPNPVGLTLTGIAIHPVSGEMYGNTESGTLVQINKQSGQGTVLQAYSSSVNVAVGDLVFLPVTPTPTPTATPTFTPPPTATSTPPPTSTPTPTPTVCPTSPDGCGCNQIKIDLERKPDECGPIDTLTKKTVPDAPIIVTKGTTVTLILENFSAVSDGTSIEVLTAGARLETSLSDLESAEARRAKASIRYDVSIKNTSSRTRSAINKQSKRNQVSFRKLAPGQYSARYRVKIMRGKKEVGTSKYSPRTRFKVAAKKK